MKPQKLCEDGGLARVGGQARWSWTNQMRRELDEMAQRWDDEIAEFTDRMQAAHEQTVLDIDHELDGVRAEIQAARDEFDRLRAVEEAIATERDFDAPLH